MDKSWIEKNLSAVPVEEVLTPKTGMVARVNYWWLEKDGHVFKAKRGVAFQCNEDRRVFDMIYEKAIRDEGFSVIHIPVAYVIQRF
ncbi:TPA: hypothetical protein ACKE3U_003736 [Klebsiella aerogenes]